MEQLQKLLMKPLDKFNKNNKKGNYLINFEHNQITRKEFRV